MDPEKRKKLFWIALAGLAGVILLIVAVIIALGSGNPGGNGAQVPDNELLVSDIYQGETLIPKFNLKRNTYDPEKFVEKNGFLQYDNAGARLGVDVSEYQGNVDWQAVKAAGMDFAIVRLGYRGMTAGNLHVDKTFEQNLSAAADAGLFVGVYFFSQAITEAEALEEAEFVLSTLNGRQIAYPVVFDWEPPVATDQLPAENLRAYNAAGGEVTEFARVFCERIREAGYTPCVYTNKYMSYHFFDLEKLKDYDLWYAEYQKAPSLYYDFRLWQYTEEGSVPGIGVPVDIDICFRPY